MTGNKKKLLILFSFLYILFPFNSFSQEIEWASKVLSFSSQLTQKQYSAEQILGYPSVMPGFGETPCAWTPQYTTRMSEEYIIVGFDKPIHVQQVAINENFNPGSVSKIYLYDPENNQSLVFYNNDINISSKTGKMNNYFIPRTDYLVNRLKLVIMINPTSGMSQIDAIAIADIKDTIHPKINLENYTEKIPQAEHLSRNINSETSELCPVISPDGRTLYFTRDKYPENIGSEKNEDIWYSNTIGNDFEMAKNLGPPINNKWNNFAFSITPDGNALLLGGVYYPNDSMSQGVSISYYKGDSWSFPQKLEIKNFYNLHKKYVGFFLSSSGRELISTLEREDSQGGMDLYVSFLQPDGTWSEPKNMGKSVNTAADEATPFLAADEVSLYFSTSGRCGFGSNDMFITRRLDTSWTNWSEPVNLGPDLNTRGWDAYYTIPASGDYAYFVSTANSYGYEDIFRVNLPEALRPKPVVMISGRVLDAKNNPVDAKIVYEILPKGTEAGIARSNPITGEYKIALPAGARYGFSANAKGFIAVNENLDLMNIKNYQEIKRDLHLVPVEQGQTIRINNIFFEFGKYELLEASFPELNRIVSFLNQNQIISIQINGYTDNIGTAQRNLILSKQRADAVAQYLISKGINANRIKVKGFGQTHPLKNNNTEEGRSQNRRVEFVILNK